MVYFLEWRDITSEKLAQKQKAAEDSYPKLISKIKAAASLGVTSCEFSESEINEFSKKLLAAEGFTVYATSKKNPYSGYTFRNGETISVWIVSW